MLGPLYAEVYHSQSRTYGDQGKTAGQNRLGEGI